MKLFASAGIDSRVWRQMRIGVVSGLLLGLFLNGFAVLPVTAIHAAITDGMSPAAIAGQLSQGQYRVGLNCPLKNHRVSYRVKAENAGGAHMALQWVMPACELSGMVRPSGEQEDTGSFVGDFHCQSSFFRKAMQIDAIGVRDAQHRALGIAKGCRVETVDQTRCSLLSPLCTLQSEDFRIEAELGKQRLLR